MLKNLFRTPTAFETDPWGFLWNQLGHAVIVGALPAWIFGLWALPFIAAGYAVWEIAQMVWHDAEGWDVIEDWSFVMTGAVAASSGSLWFGLCGLAFLIAGTLRRAS